MSEVTRKVHDGRTEVQDVELPEGLELAVRLPEMESFDLTPDQEAELRESIEEADRGETEDITDVLAWCRRA